MEADTIKYYRYRVPIVWISCSRLTLTDSGSDYAAHSPPPPEMKAMSAEQTIVQFSPQLAVHNHNHNIQPSVIQKGGDLKWSVIAATHS